MDAFESHADQLTEEVLKLSKNPEVYLAIIDTEDQGFELDIEIDEGTILATVDLNTTKLDKARELADIVDNAFQKNGIRVFKDRCDWEESLYMRTQAI